MKEWKMMQMAAESNEGGRLVSQGESECMNAHVSDSHIEFVALKTNPGMKWWSFLTGLDQPLHALANCEWYHL